MKWFRQIRNEAFWRGVVLLAVLLIPRVAMNAAADPGSGEQPSAQHAGNPKEPCAMSVVYNQGVFTVNAAQCRLRALLAEMAIRGGVEIQGGSSLDDSLITLSLSGKRLEDAIGIVLDAAGQKNIAVEYEAPAGKAGEQRVRRVFLATRAPEGTGPQAGAERGEEPSQARIIEYSNNRLTVKVKDMDVMELLAAIERALNLPGQREFRITVHDPIDARVSINVEKGQEREILEYIVHLLRPEQYAGELHTNYLVPEGAKKKSIVAYIIRKLTRQEVEERNRKIKEYLELGKDLSEQGAYLEAGEKFGAIYFLDEFNADSNYYIGLNNLRRGAPAFDSFKRVLEKDPEYVDAYYWLGVAYEKEEMRGESAQAFGEYITRGKNEKLKEEARKKLAELESPEVKQYFLNLRRAEMYESKKEIQAAESIYKDLISKQRSRPEAYVHLMRLYYFQRNLDAVYTVVQKVAEGLEKNQILFALGSAFVGKKEHAKARRVFEELLQKKPGKDLRNQVEKLMKEMN